MKDSSKKIAGKFKLFFYGILSWMVGMGTWAAVASQINSIPVPEDLVIYSDFNKDGVEDKIIHSHKKSSVPIGELEWKATQEILYGVKRIYEIPTDKGIKRFEGIEYVTEEKYKELVSQ